MNQILDLLTQHVCTTLHCYFQLRPLIPQYIQVAVDSNSPLSLHKCKRMSYLKEHLQYGQLTTVTDKKMHFHKLEQSGYSGGQCP